MNAKCHCLWTATYVTFCAHLVLYRPVDAAPTSTPAIFTTYIAPQLSSYTGPDNVGTFDSCPSGKPSCAQELPALQGYEVLWGTETASLILQSYDDKATPTLAVETTIHSTPAILTVGPSATPIRLVTFSAYSGVVVVCYSTYVTISSSRSIACDTNGVTSLTIHPATKTGLTTTSTNAYGGPTNTISEADQTQMNSNNEKSSAITRAQSTGSLVSDS